MECVVCDYKKPLKVTKKTLPFSECGLDYVVVKGVEVSKCPRCGEEYYQYGDLEKIHSAIAHQILMKEDLLSGAEVRFLRKWKGYSGKKFSTILDMSHEHLYREEGKVQVTSKLDQLVRFSIVALSPDHDYSDVREVLRGDKKRKAFERLEVKPSRGGYKALAV